MAKFNCLFIISILGLSPIDIVKLIIGDPENPEKEGLMAKDDNLAGFIIEQTKYMLFTQEGIGNPSEEELAKNCLASVMGIALNIRGAAVAYDIYLNKGLEAYLSIVNEVLFNGENEKK